MCIGVRAGTGLLRPREGAVTSLGLRMREGHAGVCLTVEGGCFQSSCVYRAAQISEGLWEVTGIRVPPARSPGGCYL